MNRFCSFVSFSVLVCCGGSAAADVPWPWSGDPEEGDATLLLLGDFNVQQRGNPADALEHVRETLNEADVVYANLEGLLVESRGPALDLPLKNGWTHLGTESVEALLAGNISAVGTANNVAFGRNNIIRSLAVLDANGIAHAGAGRNLGEAHEPAIVERNGVRFGFLQYTSKWYDESEQMATGTEAGIARLKSPDGMGIDPGDLELMLNDIAALRSGVDILVVSAHTRDGQGSGGAARATAPARPSGAEADLTSRLPVNERLQNFEPYQALFARAAIDAGADIVFGHGCHMLQAVEIYAEKPVLHCLGNFASDWIRVRDYRDGMLARVVVRDKQVQRVSLVPVTRDPETNNVRLVPPDSAEGERLYGWVRALSPSTDLVLDGDELVLLKR